MKILLVDDDPGFRRLASMALQEASIEHEAVATAHEALRVLAKGNHENFDLVLLDQELPGMKGSELLANLRRNGILIPVVLISVREGVSEKVNALDLGADDYVVKPFGVAELMARVKAVLRRRWGDDGQVVRFGEVAVNLSTRAVTRGDTPVELTAQEFKLLAHLVSNPGRTFSREELLSGAWGIDYDGTPRTVDTFVRQLRQKLEPDPEQPRYILTARGLGYRFERPGA